MTRRTTAAALHVGAPVAADGPRVVVRRAPDLLRPDGCRKTEDTVTSSSTQSILAAIPICCCSRRWSRRLWWSSRQFSRWSFSRRRCLRRAPVVPVGGAADSRRARQRQRRDRRPAGGLCGGCRFRRMCNLHMRRRRQRPAAEWR